MAANFWSSLHIINYGGSGSGTTNSLLDLINYQPDIDKAYLFAKDPYVAK